MFRIGIVLLVLFGVLLMMDQIMEKPKSIYRYVITETAGPSSLDPLDADSTRNLPVARMIYATPVEVNPDGALSSRVLESFGYDGEVRKMTWVVRPGLRFTDGSRLTAEDVAFAVARMAHKRPRFPVIEDIEGLKEWLAETNPLNDFPRGIRVQGDRIEISFARDQWHPLFRFGLEIFSIIPRRCVNPNTGHIECADIPGSGYYAISSKSDAAIEFRLIGEPLIHGRHVPEVLRFEYLKSKELVSAVSSFDEATVVTGNEVKFPPGMLAKLVETLRVSYAPSSRIGILLLNPNLGVFRDKTCRRVFADVYRDAYMEVSGGAHPSEASAFTDLLPGYLTREELASQAPIQTKDIESCRHRFKTEGVPWAHVSEEDDSFFSDLSKLVFSKLGIPVGSKFPLAGKKDEVTAFIDGRVGFLAASTGFWAMDPAGDVQMLFTPQLHGFLKYVVADERLSRFVRGLEGPGDRSSAFRNLNRYLYEEGVFNVFTHVRRFYATSNAELLSEIPVSITSPAPWQVFRVDQ